MIAKDIVGVSCLLAILFCESVFSFAQTSNRRPDSSRWSGNDALEGDHPRIQPSLALSNEKQIIEDEIELEGSLEFKPYLNVLQDAIYSNATEASSALLSKLTEMRESGDYTMEDQEAFLNQLLENGPDSRLPFWTWIRPLARFSRRARLRSLRRTLDKITPVSTVEDQSSEFRLQRRRRALVSLLRSLSSEENTDKKSSRPSILDLELKAIRASKESTGDLTSRRPEGLETPDYEVIESGKDKSNRLSRNIEIRRYQPYSVCSVSMGKPRPKEAEKTDQKLRAPELKGASSFGALAGYLFGKNDQSTAMKMTTPVFTTPTPEAKSLGVNEESETDEENRNDKQMEFVLPSNYWGMKNLAKAPKPLEGSGVRLEEKEGEERAVLMFGGYASKKETLRRQKELLASLSKQTEWKVIESTQSLAQYNDPFTVPWRRLNEVSVKVMPQDKK